MISSSGDEPVSPIDALPDPGVRLVIDLRDRPQLPAELDPTLSRFRTAQLLTASADVEAARRLHTQVYLTKGYITDDEIGEDATLHERADPWIGSSTYFAVIRLAVVVATARQIVLDEPAGLPVLRLSGLDAVALKELSGQPANAVAEISALARHPDATTADVIAVYVRMWLESISCGHRAWVMAVDVHVYRNLRESFCGNALRPIGVTQHYMGSEVVPAVLWTHELRAEQRRLAATAEPGSVMSRLPDLFPAPGGNPR